MTLTLHRRWPAAFAGACLLGALPAGAVSNTSAATDWRLYPGQAFNGVEGALDGVARLWFTDSAGASSVCSGTLLAGGRHVLTAAHCADDFSSMRVDFGLVAGVASVSRSVSVDRVWLAPGWNGTLSTGADLAVLELDAPVTSIQGAVLATGSALGRDFLFAGQGTTTTGASTQGGNWGDWGWAHWGTNTFDVTSKVFKDATGGRGDDTYGETWLFDFDAVGVGHAVRHNTLAAPNNRPMRLHTTHRLAQIEGDDWSSSTGLGASEALLAPGDSGAGAFVWDGTQWRLSGVMSWTMQQCDPRSRATCDYSAGNPSSFGDLAAATAVYSHVEWIDGILDARSQPLSVAVAVVGVVPEPSTYGMLGAGLLMLAWLSMRRRNTMPLRYSPSGK